MKAPSQVSFKDTITEFLKQPRTALCKEEEDRAAFFLRLRDDPNHRIDKIWKTLVDSDPSIDSACGRELFLNELEDAWNVTIFADTAAEVRALKRTWQTDETKMKKALARSFSSKSARELLASLDDIRTKLRRFVNHEDYYKRFCQNEFYPLVDIRSDRAGSRIRTVFMRVASDFMRRVTGEWHDDWVADLTDIAFPPGENEKATSEDMVRSARRGMRL